MHSGAGEREHRAATAREEERGERERRDATARDEKRAGSAGMRHDVYIVWMTPKTKVCTANADAASTGQKGPSHK